VPPAPGLQNDSCPEIRQWMAPLAPLLAKMVLATSALAFY
jgi:hypothetical protein